MSTNTSHEQMKPQPITGTVLHHPTAEYAIEARLGSHHVDFRVFSYMGHAKRDGEIVALYERNEDLKEGETKYQNGDPVEDLALAEPDFYGSVKWDGCSDWNLMPRDCMAHFCNGNDLLLLGEIMAFCWDWAQANLPTSMKRSRKMVAFDSNDSKVVEA